jgi:hypothetical protein
MTFDAKGCCSTLLDVLSAVALHVIQLSVLLQAADNKVTDVLVLYMCVCAPVAVTNPLHTCMAYADSDKVLTS